MLNEEQWKTCYDLLMGTAPRQVQWHYPHPPYYSAYGETLFAWDQYFEAILQMYLGMAPDYACNGARILLARQRESGLGPRSVKFGDRVYPKHFDGTQPFVCQTILVAAHRTGSVRWLGEEKIYPRLKKYLDYWLDHEDRRGAGLSVWRGTQITGMDNLFERAGGRDETFFCEGVDLNAYLVRECGAMALLADMLGEREEAAHYAGRAKERAEAMRKWLWNEESGMFLDYHAVEKRPIPVKCVSTFSALWAGVATADQAKRLVEEHLRNPREFKRPWPVPALAADQPGYHTGHLPGEVGCSWRAFTWAPTNYYVVHGLRAYGYEADAMEIAEKSEDLLRHNKFCEYYSSEHGIGTGRKPFMGWTGLFLFMRGEQLHGLDPTRLSAVNHSGTEMRALLEKGDFIPR